MGVSDEIPPAFDLSAPRPNPSRTGTTLSLALPFAQRVTAEVLGIDGRSVRALAENATLAAGRHALVWDGRDRAGARVGAGIYLVRVRSESGAAIAKVTLLR